MATKNINLLPPELANGGSVGKVLFIVRGLAISMSAGLIVLLALGAVTLYLLGRQLSSLNSQQESLKQSVRSLEKTESGMVLTRDRLAKVQGVLSGRVVEDRFNKQRLILQQARGDINFSESLADGIESNLVIETPSSISLSDLFDSFFASPGFERLVMNSLQFSPFLGYRVELGVF